MEVSRVKRQPGPEGASGRALAKQEKILHNLKFDTHARRHPGLWTSQFRTVLVASNRKRNISLMNTSAARDQKTKWWTCSDQEPHATHGSNSLPHSVGRSVGRSVIGELPGEVAWKNAKQWRYNKTCLPRCWLPSRAACEGNFLYAFFFLGCLWFVFRWKMLGCHNVVSENWNQYIIRMVWW